MYIHYLVLLFYFIINTNWVNNICELKKERKTKQDTIGK